jgi:hypothetical protein
VGYYLYFIYLEFGERSMAIAKKAVYGHSFSPTFYGDVYMRTSPKGHAENVADAIRDFWEEDEEQFLDMVDNVFPEWAEIDIDEYLLDSLVADIMDKIRKTDTVTDLSPPVEVWIDDEGFYTVLVHEPKEENNKFAEYASRRLQFVVTKL